MDWKDLDQWAGLLRKMLLYMWQNRKIQEAESSLYFLIAKRFPGCYTLYNWDKCRLLKGKGQRICLDITWEPEFRHSLE